MTPEICPNCGAEVPAKARACPECGADEQTGWSEKAKYDQLGIPDESFNYEEFVREEFEGGRSNSNSRNFHYVWLFFAVLLILALTAFFWRR